MLFSRKPKPIRTIGLIDLSGKAVYYNHIHYIPKQISFFETEAKFELFRCTDDTREPQVITVPLSEERLWHVMDEVLFWDSTDEVFRIRTEPQGQNASIWENARIYENQVLEIDANWADTHLTPEALTYAQKADTFYRWYCSDGSASPVVFEWPKFFIPFKIPEEAREPDANWAFTKIHPLAPDFDAVTNQMMAFTPSYLDAFFESEEEFFPQYKKNVEKEYK